MTPKIEWFKEILAQEPSSRVFFPLAKLLYDAKDVSGTINTLQKGLVHNPDFFEARLFLIHIFYGEGNVDACSEELKHIARIFNEYPNFLKAWGKAGVSVSGEFGVFMDLVSTLTMQPDLTLWAFLTQGLKAVKNSKPEVQGSHIDFLEQEKNIADDNITTYIDASHGSVSDEVSVDENGMLCTRSMADILSEQGDIAGALKIYKELEVKAISEEEKKELREQQARLSVKLAEYKNIDTAGEAPLPFEYGINLQGGVIKMLENLVDRLEDRAKN